MSDTTPVAVPNSIASVIIAVSYVITAISGLLLAWGQYQNSRTLKSHTTELTTQGNALASVQEQTNSINAALTVRAAAAEATHTQDMTDKAVLTERLIHASPPPAPPPKDPPNA